MKFSHALFIFFAVSTSDHIIDMPKHVLSIPVPSDCYFSTLINREISDETIT
jgi:hypothetical protein